MSMIKESLCRTCNKSFCFYPSKSKGYYCSRKCKSNDPQQKQLQSKIAIKRFTGIRHSDETKRKIGEKNKIHMNKQHNKERVRQMMIDNPPMRNHKSKEKMRKSLIKAYKEGIIKPSKTVFKKGHIPYLKGKRHTQETKKKISLSKRNLDISTRIKISMGRRGISEFDGFTTPKLNRIRKSAQYIQWRKSVFLRDDYTCQACGKKGCYIEAHHIKSFAKYPNIRFDLNNGITYCRPCHIKLDQNIGKKIGGRNYA